MNREYNIDCNKCKHMDLKEEFQVDLTEIHRCMFYKTRCFHGNRNKSHYKIHPCFKCEDDNYKNYTGGIENEA